MTTRPLTIAQRRALARIARLERKADEAAERYRRAPRGQRWLALVRARDARTKALRATP